MARGYRLSTEFRDKFFAHTYFSPLFLSIDLICMKLYFEINILFLPFQLVTLLGDL